MIACLPFTKPVYLKSPSNEFGACQTPTISTFYPLWLDEFPEDKNYT